MGLRGWLFGGGARTARAGGGKRAPRAWWGGALRQFSQGYDASRIGRRLRGWFPDRRTINALLAAGGEMLRARARQLCRENPYAANAAEAFTAAAVGVGIVPSPTIEDEALKSDVKKLWNRWISEADADGITDFYGLQALAARAMFEAGECFLRFRPRRLSDGLSVPLQIQILESEMLPFTLNQPAGNGGGNEVGAASLNAGNVIREGIEFDQIGRRVAYWFYRSHPGEVYPVVFDFSYSRVPASEVLHLYKPLRPGQIRGQPGITPAMVRLYLLDLYDDAELDRKKVAAMFAGFVTKASPEADSPLYSQQSEGALSEEHTPDATIAPLEPGMMSVLAPGEDIKFSNPSEVGNSYEQFVWRNLLAICAGMGVPYSAVTGDSSKSNYSSSREQQVEFRRRIDGVQHLVLVFQACRPVWRRFFEAAVMAGALPVPPRDFLADPEAFVSAKWIPPKWDWVDPLKDRKAMQLAVDEGWTSRDDVIEAEGEDPEETDRRIKASQDREERMGLKFRRAQERINVNVAADADSAQAAVEGVDQGAAGP